MKWIPVSKQAPETCLDVLATLQTADGRIVVKVAYSVSAETWRIPGLPGTVKVIAWMPLPEPFKGE